MSRTPANTAVETLNEIASIRMDLKDSDPLIWRQVEVPAVVSLKVLHEIIQVIMGWLDYHLWEFTIAGQRYGLPAQDEGWRDAPLIDAAKVRLRDVLKSRKNVIDYLYDFGDSWELRLTATSIRPGEPGVGYPRYIGGEHNAPPEDCGGMPGFYAALDALADPKHPDHAEIKEWFGDYDANEIDELPIKYALGRIANRRRATQTRVKKNPPR